MAAATRIQRSAVFRLLYTLEKRGYVERLDNKKYRSTYRQRRIRIGYMAPLTGTPFRAVLAAGIRQAAAVRNVELNVLDNNEDDPNGCLANANQLIESKVDAALIFQPNDSITHTVADRFFHASIPLISIEKPIPGAFYFGANNYQAGRLAGRVLGKFAQENWHGQFDRLVLLESVSTGPAVHARVTGVLAGLKEIVGRINDSAVVHLETHAQVETSRRAISEWFATVPRGTRLLISGFNDPSAEGAVQAVRSARREKDVAIVGQNATEESRKEIRNPAGRFIASIAYFPERYGSRVLSLALSIVNRQPAPPAVYTEHVVVDRYNIDKYYGGTLRSESSLAS